MFISLVMAIICTCEFSKSWNCTHIYTHMYLFVSIQLWRCPGGKLNNQVFFNCEYYWVRTNFVINIYVVKRIYVTVGLCLLTLSLIIHGSWVIRVRRQRIKLGFNLNLILTLRLYYLVCVLVILIAWVSSMQYSL